MSHPTRVSLVLLALFLLSLFSSSPFTTTIFRQAMASRASSALNVLGTPLQRCGCDPMTGWYRDGYCATDSRDAGRHSVCCRITNSFLTYTKAKGNDLSTPRPAYGFPGLKDGDHWCVCASRWLEAHNDGFAPPVILERCEESTLEVVPLSLLQSNALSEDGGENRPCR